MGEPTERPVAEPNVNLTESEATAVQLAKDVLGISVMVFKF
jgi:hypothetical protein